MTSAYDFGPVIEHSNVRFRLWAPSREDIAVELETGETARLDARADGWKEAVLPGGAGTRYRFRSGEIIFPDPASRLQQGGIHGWSVVCAPSALPAQWRGRTWQQTILYELHTGLCGGFAGVGRRFPSLADLGVTAVELMPVAAFPGERNWGYDGVLPFAPAESYGTPDELRVLVEYAHKFGIMMFLDVVYNHFGPDGNYLPFYAKRFFRDDVTTPWGPAIDFQERIVRQFFSENARYWIHEFGFDGLRFDAVHAIADRNWLVELAAELGREAGDRHIHLILENENNETRFLRNGFDAQWNDDIHHAFHVLLTDEYGGYYADFVKAPAEKLALALKEGFIFQGESSSSRDGGACVTSSGDLEPTAFVAFLQNHDQIGNRAFGERLTVLVDPRALKAAVALLLLSPQIPMIFMGEEVGSRAPFLYFTDHEKKLASIVREGRRREFAAFANVTDELPDPNALASFEASEPFDDAPEEARWREYYRDLLTLRRERIVPYLGRAKAIDAHAVGDKAVVARWQLDGGKTLALAANFGNQTIPAVLPGAAPLWGSIHDGALLPYTTLAWVLDS